jgi:hypothetical protein
MKQRPLLFIFLATLHLIEPVVKLIYFKAITPFSFSTIISNITAMKGPLQLFEFWFLFPLGGLALLGVKKWSYPLFVGVQVYSLYSHITYEQFAAPYFSEIPFFSSLFLLVLNILIVIYFSMPDVRKPFFDKKLRWWETSTRHDIRIPMTVSIINPDILHDCEIINISRSGIFANFRGVIDNGHVITMNITWKDYHITLKGTKVSNHTVEGERGIGVHFKFDNIWEDLYMRKMVREVAKTLKKQDQVLSAAA